MSTPTVTSTDTGPEPNTPAQASLYQQLRGHLAALKLHTAAEHLPAVLDTASTQGLSLTAALERTHRQGECGDRSDRFQRGLGTSRDDAEDDEADRNNREAEQAHPRRSGACAAGWCPRCLLFLRRNDVVVGAGGRCCVGVLGVHDLPRCAGVSLRFCG
jgi:hypothetical protein